MIGFIAYAFRNVWRSRVRTVALLTIICAGVAVLALIAAGYEDLFYTAGLESVEADGDILLVDETKDGSGAMTRDDYLSARERLLESGLVREVLSTSAIEGIVGGIERSAPCSGIAVEGRASVANGDAPMADGVVPATMGESLAKTLGVKKGDILDGLVNDCGMALRLEKTVRTEALLKDRFYLELPVEAFLELDEKPDIASIKIWLTEGLSPPTLNSESRSQGYAEAEALISSIPELSGYAVYSMPRRNTRVDQIVRIYRTNYRVVLSVVVLTLFLAFLNVLALSVHERQQELGTLRSLGTPLSRIRLLLLCETLMIAAISWAIGAAFSVIASAIINANGGLVFAAPPGETADITVGSRLYPSSVLGIGALVVLGALAACVVSAAALGRSSVVEQLEVRD